ncbi:hypothetical protein PQU92_08895 [Asticcacaulis sp. BYS171W]|uniref:Uncharacterized protein n=1 Tax=Asticcacaulis aquaticus TaxID=2984212 RepID=A0ABT5HU67_9CAUL|nr:hypothetical protein [Asticcacaulis aquaticus]MDC7683390.1 hypothetical protein [Asticcacaulis aquaticus]
MTQINFKSHSARYTLSILGWMTLYVILLLIVGFYARAHPEPTPLLYTLAVLPSLPVGMTIWCVLRFMSKTDEYMRAILTERFVTATGLTLFLCTAWGFLINYAQVQSPPLYMVYPMFWIFYGISCAFIRSVK